MLCSSASSAAVLMFDLSLCVQTLTPRGKQERGESPEYILKSSKKTQCNLCGYFLFCLVSDDTYYHCTLSSQPSCASWIIIMINSSMNMYVTCFGDLVLFSSKLIVSPLFCSHGTWKKPTLSYIYIQMRKMRNE